jgi:hypothetical protein
MKKIFIPLTIILLHSFNSLAQPCIQPGSLVAVRNVSTEKYEYIIFKFLKPHADKGILSSGTSELFPFNKGEKNSYHRIVFNNVTHLCYNKINVVTTGRKLVNFKVQQKTDNMVSYVFELAAGAKITGHYVKQHQDLYYVKIRIE